MTSETTVDAKNECQTIKRALDAEIKRLEGEIEEGKIAISAQKSLEKTIQANDKILKEIQNSELMSDDLTDGGETSLDGVISDLEVGSLVLFNFLSVFKYGKKNHLLAACVFLRILANAHF